MTELILAINHCIAVLRLPGLLAGLVCEYLA